MDNTAPVPKGYTGIDSWTLPGCIIPPMPLLRSGLMTLLAVACVAAQSVSFPTEDGGRVCADLYGRGTRGVVLAHGGQFKKESWRPQALALQSAGFRVLALDFRGFGCSSGPGQADFDTAPFEKDVLAAVRYLKHQGAKTVSAVGGSFGGGAAGDASIRAAPGEIDRVVFLGAAPNLPADRLHSRTLFIVARDDANGAGIRLPGIRAQYEKAPYPKELIVLDGPAHAQFLFQTAHGPQVMREFCAFSQLRNVRSRCSCSCITEKCQLHYRQGVSSGSMQYPLAPGLRFNDFLFTEPVRLRYWIPPTHAGIAVLLARDSHWAPKPFQPLYFREFGNNAAPVAMPPSDDLYVSVLAMPCSTDAQRRTVRNQLVASYNPVYQRQSEPAAGDLARRIDEIEARQDAANAQILSMLSHLCKLFEPQPVAPRRPIGFLPEPAY